MRLSPLHMPCKIVALRDIHNCRGSRHVGGHDLRNKIGFIEVRVNILASVRGISPRRPTRGVRTNPGKHPSSRLHLHVLVTAHGRKHVLVILLRSMSAFFP